jgi:hypothetical protein
LPFQKRHSLVAGIDGEDGNRPTTALRQMSANGRFHSNSTFAEVIEAGIGVDGKEKVRVHLDNSIVFLLSLVVVVPSV